MEQVKLLSMTGMLTVLIWAAADTLISESGTAAVSLKVVSNVEGMVINELPGAGSLEIDVIGPRKVIETVKVRTPLRARMTIGDQPTGRASITLEPEGLKAAIAELNSDFRRLSITAIRPSSIQVEIDHLISRKVTLTADNLATRFDVPPQISPAEVTAQILESRLNDPATTVSETLDISESIDRVFRNIPRGSEKPLRVALDDSRFRSFDPPEVVVTGTVSLQEVTGQVSIPILLAASFANFNKPFKPVKPDGSAIELLAPSVAIKGAPEAIEAVESGEAEAYGIIRLRRDDFQSGMEVRRYRVQYRLPPEVSLVGEPPWIELRLINPADAPNE